MRRRLLVVLCLLPVLVACDWRGYEHERKVHAQADAAAASQASAEDDAFNNSCTKDAGACWQALVRAAKVSALGPPAGQTGVTQVCCYVPATAVTTDQSFPSGFTEPVGSGTLTLFVSRHLGTIQGNTTVRHQPARTLATGKVLRYEWQESGLTYEASVQGADDAHARAALDALVLHTP